MELTERKLIALELLVVLAHLQDLHHAREVADEVTRCGAARVNLQLGSPVQETYFVGHQRNRLLVRHLPGVDAHVIDHPGIAP